MQHCTVTCSHAPCTLDPSLSYLLELGPCLLFLNTIDFNRANRKHTVHVDFQNRERFQNMLLFALETHLHEIFYVLVPTCSLHCQQVRVQCHPKPHALQKEAPLALAGLVGGPKNLAKPEESSTESSNLPSSVRSLRSLRTLRSLDTRWKLFVAWLPIALWRSAAMPLRSSRYAGWNSLCSGDLVQQAVGRTCVWCCSLCKVSCDQGQHIPPSNRR
jgi:hypothetical protein